MCNNCVCVYLGLCGHAISVCACLCVISVHVLSRSVSKLWVSVSGNLDMSMRACVSVCLWDPWHAHLSLAVWWAAAAASVSACSSQRSPLPRSRSGKHGCRGSPSTGGPHREDLPSGSAGPANSSYSTPARGGGWWHTGESESLDQWWSTEDLTSLMFH